MDAQGTRASGVSGEVSQYLTFLLAAEQYGIEILKVQEIKGYTAPTPVPGAPPHVRGVMNLRGTVVPVVDLRARFGMAATAPNPFTVVIVVTVGKRVFGLVVDGVSDVLDIGAGEVEPVPELGRGVDVSYLKGMAKAGERLIALLDIDQVLGQETSAAAAV